MPKKKNNKVQQEVEENQVDFAVLDPAIAEVLQAQQSNSHSDIKIQMIAIAKDVLERNAALQWEQDKTRGLTITVDEIINEADKLVKYVAE